tara:strand:+ start:1070 stop:1516 length:447 start_codon:yes stop_codon:yes gene_type:complete
MVNADPTYIPEDETAEEKAFREELVAEADRFEERHGKRPIFEIPIDPWDDDEEEDVINEDLNKTPVETFEKDSETYQEIQKNTPKEDPLTYYKAREFETLTYCELKEFRKAAALCREKELAKKVLNRMRFLSKTGKVTEDERIAAAYL